MSPSPCPLIFDPFYPAFQSLHSRSAAGNTLKTSGYFLSSGTTSPDRVLRQIRRCSASFPSPVDGSFPSASGPDHCPAFSSNTSPTKRAPPFLFIWRRPSGGTWQFPKI